MNWFYQNKYAYSTKRRKIDEQQEMPDVNLFNGCGMRRGSYAAREQVRERLRERCGAEVITEPVAAR